MFRLFAVLVALVSVHSFVPATKSFRTRTASLSMEISSEIQNALGAQAPLGYFDPVGFMKDCDMEQFEAVRERELKHGRICMLVFLGNLLNTLGVRLPGGLHPEGGPYDTDGLFIPFASIRSGLAGLEDVPSTGIAQIAFLIGLLELGYGARKDLIGEVHIEAARQRFGWTDEIIEEQKAKELNNGRGAMMGVLGIFTHELIGQPPFQPLL